MIRPVQVDDAEQICDIYNFYVQNTIISFETEIVSVEEMKLRIQSKAPKAPWIIYLEERVIIGYAYAGKWRERVAYENCVESSVYLSQSVTGRGIGSRLYKELMKRIKQAGYHTVLGCIALPNEESISLHEKLGFEKIAHFKEVGKKFSQWVDVGYWELLMADYRNN
ncbi:MAG: N-acetyltransferase [Proteobacteria bacterium]|nr:N-acetyltransferase [Pseudomonadota bacterium]